MICTVNRTTRLVSISTGGALLMLFLIASGCATRKQNSQPQDTIAPASPKIVQIVKSLGTDPKKAYARHVDDFTELAQWPVAATELLINELEAIDLVQLQNEDNDSAIVAKGYHIVWCLRAIYFMTGERFCAQTAYKFTNSDLDENRKGLIYDYHKPRNVMFFVEWMSRGTVYFAPVDAQQKIITQWRSWFERHGTTHHYQKDAGLNDWYFG